MHLEGFTDHKPMPSKSGKDITMTVIERLADSTENGIDIFCILHILNQNAITAGSEHSFPWLTKRLFGIADALDIRTDADRNLF